MPGPLQESHSGTLSEYNNKQLRFIYLIWQNALCNDNIHQLVTYVITIINNLQEELKQIEIQTLSEFFAVSSDPLAQKHGLLYLPHSYVVPGGRFNEMYNWDSYFINIGYSNNNIHNVGAVELVIYLYLYLYIDTEFVCTISIIDVM